MEPCEEWSFQVIEGGLPQGGSPFLRFSTYQNMSRLSNVRGQEMKNEYRNSFGWNNHAQTGRDN